MIESSKFRKMMQNAKFICKGMNSKLKKGKMSGNKCDQESKRKVQASRAQQWCKTKNDIPYHETSAATAQNVEAAFQEIARKALKQEHVEEQIYLPETLTLNANQGLNNNRPQGQDCAC